ncbi:MAG TPA: sigma-70 family RNA polymerase sigma factor [Lacunisphaera sp.]
MKTRSNDSLKTSPVTTKPGRPAQLNSPHDDAAGEVDVELVRRFKGGDESTFTEIVHRHYSRIRALANRTLRFTGDVDEVTQDTFIRAHRNLHNFRGDCSLSTWLYRICLNLARNRYWFHFRRQRQNTLSLNRTVDEAGAKSLVDILANGSANPLSESTTNEFLALVAECMQRLDARHREILTMRTTLELSYEEIAVNLGINVGTVKSRIARARARLREQLYQLAPEFGQEATSVDFFEIDRTLPSTALSVT